MLERLKEERGARSFDDLLGGIARKDMDIPKSLFGGVKGLSTSYGREHEDRL